MKKLTLPTLQRFILLCFFSCLQLLSFAQDNTGSATTKSTTETTTTKTEFYTQPWVWVVGGIVLILIIAALVRGNNSSTKEVSRTTVIKD